MAEEKNIFNSADDAFEEGDVCKVCGGSLKKEPVNLEELEGGKLYVIEKVPAMVCQECGETWVPKQYMEEFEKMKAAVKEKNKQVSPNLPPSPAPPKKPAKKATRPGKRQKRSG